MLYTAKALENYAIEAKDGVIGHLKDFYFDDKSWVVRYIVVHTGDWLAGRKVLISPMSVGNPDWSERLLPVSLTKEQVKRSPDIDTEKPVSRQQEVIYSGYYDLPYYWEGPGYWGDGMYADMVLRNRGVFDASHATAQETEDARAAKRVEHGDPHLRSFNAVQHYHIHASDGDIGHVRGMLLDDRTWAIRYLIVDTSNWWLGHQVLIAPPWIDQVDWFSRTVSVKMTRQAVKDAPVYDPQASFERLQEDRLYDHYGRRGYWSKAQELEAGIARD